MALRGRYIIFTLVMALTAVFAGEVSAAVEAPAIVRKIVEHRDFFRSLKGLDKHRIYDVKPLSVGDAGASDLRNTAQKLIGLMVYDETGVLQTLIFDRETRQVVTRLDARVEKKDVRQRKMAESIKIEDAVKIAEAAHRHGAGARIRISQNANETPVELEVPQPQERTEMTAAATDEEWNYEVALANLRQQVQENEKNGLYANYDRDELMNSYRAEVRTGNLYAMSP